MTRDIRIKRVYEAPDESDGKRILVDRLWPRGVKKEDAALDGWDKDVAPSPALRKWFGHDPDRWADFQRRYKAELKSEPDAAKALLEQYGKNRLTLLYAAHDEKRNHALVLARFLRKLG